MTPEQRAALVDLICDTNGWTTTTGAERALAAIEAAGYTIVRDAEHVEAIALRTRVAGQRHEIAQLHGVIADMRQELDILRSSESAHIAAIPGEIQREMKSVPKGDEREMTT